MIQQRLLWRIPKSFFAKYNKLKRTYEALSELVVETKADLDHLDSISTALSLSEDEKDLQLIKDELSDYGYIKSHGKKRERNRQNPNHYILSLLMVSICMLGKITIRMMN